MRARFPLIATLFFVPVVFSLCHRRGHVKPANDFPEPAPKEEELATV